MNRIFTQLNQRKDTKNGKPSDVSEKMHLHSIKTHSEKLLDRQVQQETQALQKGLDLTHPDLTWLVVLIVIILETLI
mgnify:FL=1